MLLHRIDRIWQTWRSAGSEGVQGLQQATANASVSPTYPQRPPSMAGRRIDALRAALAPERCGATPHPPAEWGAEALLPGGGWAAARSERGAEALIGALRRHSFAWVRWHRPRRDDATPAELFEATAKVFRSERLRSQFYADPAADAAAQAEMKPGSSSRFASFNRLPGKDYAYLRCDAERRLLPPRRHDDADSVLFERLCCSMWRQFGELGAAVLQAVGTALGEDEGALARLTRRGPRSRAASRAEQAHNGSAGEDTNSVLFLLRYLRHGDSEPHTDIDLLTLVSPETAPGLEVIDAETGRWVKPFQSQGFAQACQAGQAERETSEIFCVLAGETLGFVTGLPPGMHRVVPREPEGSGPEQDVRMSSIGLIYVK